jgi:hypothetical protein
MRSGGSICQKVDVKSLELIFINPKTLVQYFFHSTYHSVLYETGTMALVERVVKHGVAFADVVRKRWPPK